jgi:HlyD family secretion protein
MDEKIGAQPTVLRPSPEAVKGPVKKRGAWFSRRFVVVALVLVAAVAGGAWWLSQRKAQVHYLTMPATRGNVTRVVSATGTVNPELTIIVGAYVSGTIRQLFCDYNTIVRAGQICAKIDPHPYQAILDQYQGQLARDQGLLAEAEANLTRYQLLAEQNSIARQQAEDQAFLVEQDKGTVQLDGGLVEGAKINLAYTDIVAPVDGVVVSRAVTQGQTVASGFQTPTLFLIATDLAKMQVDTNASESDVGGIKEGNPASFGVDAFPKRIFNGKVVQLRNSPQTVQNVVTFDAVISVHNNDFALLPGMTASTRIVIAERDGVIRVPNQALRYVPGGLSAASPSGTSTTGQPKTAGGNEAQLWVLRDGKAQQVNVTLGLDDDNFTEIVAGDVKPGDAVIVGEESNSSQGSSKLPLPRL